jgi:heme oxygenase
LLVQYEALYQALEEAVAANTDATIEPFLAAELVRLPPLRADLDFLVGPDWARLPVLSATAAYCEHLRELPRSWPGGLLAHHYVRYLGDLSGGQIVGRILRRVLNLDDERGTAFYRFDAIASAKAFKTRYRAMLDELPWGDVARQRLIDETIAAFHANTAILLELAPEPSFVDHRRDVVDG